MSDSVSPAAASRVIDIIDLTECPSDDEKGLGPAMALPRSRSTPAAASSSASASSASSASLIPSGPGIDPEFPFEKEPPCDMKENAELYMAWLKFRCPHRTATIEAVAKELGEMTEEARQATFAFVDGRRPALIEEVEAIVTAAEAASIVVKMEKELSPPASPPAPTADPEIESPEPEPESEPESENSEPESEDEKAAKKVARKAAKAGKKALKESSPTKSALKGRWSQKRKASVTFPAGTPDSLSVEGSRLRRRRL
eukprot:tig00000459_g1151.t1